MLQSAIIVLTICLLVLLSSPVEAFRANTRFVQVRKNGVTMEYIPDGLTKAQWAAIKKKELEDKKARANGSLGTNRFKSRSFEAWQKSGGKHLFPVDPTTTPYEERPYMQRKNGDWEGSDLESKGLQGVGQGAASRRLRVDDMYEKAKKEGKLDSISIFGGKPLPWTSAAADKLNNSKEKKPVPGKTFGVAGKKRSEEEMKRLKANVAKVSRKEEEKKKALAAAGGEEKPKKKKFGFF